MSTDPESGFPSHLLDLVEGEVAEVSEADGKMLIEKKLAGDPDSPTKPRQRVARRPPETSEARKARVAREDQSREEHALAEPEGAFGHTGPITRTPEGHGGEKKGVDPDVGTLEKPGAVKRKG